MRKPRSALLLLWLDMLPWLCFLAAMVLGVVVFTDWIIPFPENWPR